MQEKVHPDNRYHLEQAVMTSERPRLVVVDGAECLIAPRVAVGYCDISGEYRVNDL